MRRILTGMLCMLVLLAGCAVGEAEEFIMAGFDPSDAGHVWDDNLFFLRREEMTGDKFQFRQFEDEDEWTRAKSDYLKGVDLPDVLFKAELTTAETQKLYDAGVLIDLKPYLSEYAPNLSKLLQEHPEYEKAITLPDGAIVALPQIHSMQSNNALWINSTWLKRLNMEAPTTAEELTQVLRAFKNQDPNRNGKNDEIPLTFTGMWDLRFLAHAFGFVGNDYYLEVRDGKLISDIQQDGYRDFLQWLHQLWEEGLIDHNGFVSLDSTRQITDNNATITYGCVFGPTILNLLPAGVIKEYDVVLPLTSERGQVYRNFLGDVIRGTFAITSKCKNPGEMLSWVDYLYSSEGCFLASAGRLHDEYEVTSEGTWYWVDDVQTVQNSILKDVTITEGASMPLLLTDDYELNFDDETTRNAVKQLSELRTYAVEPYPLVYLTEEETAVISSIWPDIATLCETGLTWFVTGDVAISDETWADFQTQIAESGMDRIISIFETALER